MRGIEANAEPFRLAHVLDDVREMLEAMAETRTLTGGRFERDLRFHFRQNRMHGVDRFDDSFQSGFFARAEMRARMQNEKRQLELIRPNEFFRERAQRIRVKLRIGRREIDQVIRSARRPR